jgi:hypothetical protein
VAVQPERTYRMVLASDRPVSHALQAHIFNWGKTSKDYELLAVLAAVKGLSPEVDAKLSKVTNHLVQAAYVSRPDRDPEILSARAQKDTRVSVLEPLASCANLSAQAYHALARSSSRAVALPLAANTAAPLEDRTKAVSTVVNSMFSAGYGEISIYHKMLKEQAHLVGPAFTDMLASEPSQHSDLNVSILLSAIFGSAEITIDDFGLDEADLLLEIMLRELQNALRSHKEKAAKKGGAYYGSAGSLATILGQIVAAMASAKISQARRDEFAALATAELTSTLLVKEIKLTLQRLLVVTGYTTEEKALTSLAEITESKDCQRLTEIAQNLDPKDPQTPAWASALVCNKHADVGVVHTVLERVGPRMYDLAKLAQARIEDHDVVVELAKSNRCAMRDELLSTSKNPSALYVTLCEAVPEIMSSYAPHSVYVTSDSLGKLPVSFLERAETASDKVREMVTDLITTNLGDNIRAWELFDDLSTHVPGSIEHLFAHIEAMLRVAEQTHS